MSQLVHAMEAKAPKKRARVALSCAPCRASKLKCDRVQPCVQCSKKGRFDLCLYAPRPEKQRSLTKGVTARLKRLEGMVREMMDDEGAAVPQGLRAGPGSAPLLRGQVIHGERATTYVGATHCLAMLEDIEDIKTYFEDADGSDDNGNGNGSLKDDPETPDMLPFHRSGGARTREALLAHLPEKHVSDRIVTRYFSSKTPSQFVIHQPTFTKAYSRFWQDPDTASLHWISLLFTILARGVYHNSFLAPHEVSHDSPTPIKERVRQYRACAASALTLGKYAQPTADTMMAFICYIEADFVLNLAEQTNCYLLSGVCLRLMLKMGYHRDPSKLANISPFEGEMRRRHWCMALQLDTLVSFHMGLPPLAHGLEMDVELPHNLEDVDFGPDSAELPPARPLTDYTVMSYAIYKRRILDMFTKIAHQAHSLSAPKYDDVLRLDKALEDVWGAVPAYLRVRPLDECVGEPPSQILQRFGIASLHHKSVCVLHRRYLAEPSPDSPDHNCDYEYSYSRRRCLESAMALLDFQHATWEGCKPGNILGPSAWFATSLAVHDFMLAAVILYVIVQSSCYADDGTGFGKGKGTGTKTGTGTGKRSPTKEDLKRMMRRTYDISCTLFHDATEQRKTVFALGLMLERLGCPVASSTASSSTSVMSSTTGDVHGPANMQSTASEPRLLSTPYYPSIDPKPTSMSMSMDMDMDMDMDMNMNMNMNMNMDLSVGLGMNFDFSSIDGPAPSNPDFSWMFLENLDWRHLDASLGQYRYSFATEANGQHSHLYL